MTPAEGRLNRKWAMVGHKGGKCVVCDGRVTPAKIEGFDFHHKAQINTPHDKTDRWSGGVRDWPPFTDAWFAWAERVDLICQDCHREQHRPRSIQLTIDWDAQARLDALAAQQA